MSIKKNIIKFRKGQKVKLNKKNIWMYKENFDKGQGRRRWENEKCKKKQYIIIEYNFIL